MSSVGDARPGEEADGIAHSARKVRYWVPSPRKGPNDRSRVGSRFTRARQGWAAPNILDLASLAGVIEDPDVRLSLRGRGGPRRQCGESAQGPRRRRLVSERAAHQLRKGRTESVAFVNSPKREDMFEDPQLPNPRGQSHHPAARLAWSSICL